MHLPLPWILIASVGALILLGALVFVVIKKKKGGHKPDYRAFFFIGIA